MKMLFDATIPEITAIDTSLLSDKKITLLVARLDKIHPVISGNKLFKLHYFLEGALQKGYKMVLTFGGAYSNHLVATAYACKISGIESIGIVRGERPTILSHTLLACESYGMRLQFISREKYQKKSDIELQQNFDECLLIPEGGYDSVGANGAALIMNQLKSLHATHVCTAIGTATTFAGLIQNRPNNEMIIGIPVLKKLDDISQRLLFLNGHEMKEHFTIFDEYHFGGYAKKTTALIEYMNDLYEKYHLPTDFVYTAKMMFAVTDKIKAGYFADGSVIVCLHTGGLQGNASLPTGTLVF